jgi:hypothetical protein
MALEFRKQIWLWYFELVEKLTLRFRSASRFGYLMYGNMHNFATILNTRITFGLYTLKCKIKINTHTHTHTHT